MRPKNCAVLLIKQSTDDFTTKKPNDVDKKSSSAITFGSKIIQTIQRLMKPKIVRSFLIALFKKGKNLFTFLCRLFAFLYLIAPLSSKTCFCQSLVLIGGSYIKTNFMSGNKFFAQKKQNGCNGVNF